MNFEFPIVNRMPGNFDCACADCHHEPVMYIGNERYCYKCGVPVLMCGWQSGKALQETNAAKVAALEKERDLWEKRASEMMNQNAELEYEMVWRNGTWPTAQEWREKYAALEKELAEAKREIEIQKLMVISEKECAKHSDGIIGVLEKRILRKALEPFAAMHREGSDPEEVACERGIASGLTILTSGDFAKAADALDPQPGSKEKPC